MPCERFDITRGAALEELGELAETIDDLEAPRAELARRSAARERQPRPPPLARDGEIARIDLALLVGVDRRAFGEQTVEEQQLEERQRVPVDADRVGRAEIERADLDVLHAAAAQRDRRALGPALPRLRANLRVVLVLDLQDVRVQLPILAVDLDADLG